jgi:23S rRNA (guanine745-N1)-methyltransferase
MLSDVLDLLACPLCRASLTWTDARRVAVRGSCGHTFDVARQGYVSLLAGDADLRPADTPAMVQARGRVLDAGAFDAVREAVSRAVATMVPRSPRPVVVDVGAGPGGYLRDALTGRSCAVGIGLDLSRAAARRAARAHPRIGSVVADVWRGLPLLDHVADVLLNVFAPHNPREFARVLHRRGGLVVVTPAPDHLREIRDRGALIDIQADKERRLAAAFSPWLRQTDRVAVRSTVAATRQLVADLVAMGPSSRHPRGAGFAERLIALPPVLETTVAVQISLWKGTADP